MRKKLLSSFNVWTKVDNDKVRAIGEVVQMLHNASLLLDDIEDNSILRRGIPVAHKIFGKFYFSIITGFSSSSWQIVGCYFEQKSWTDS